MKVLGRGWQYTTYDLGNGRVLKKYNSALVGYVVQFLSFLRWGSPLPWKIPAYHRNCKNTARDSMEKVAHSPLEPWMMGNPHLLNELDYEQDTMVSLLEKLLNLPVEEGKKLIDAFVAFNKILFERSFIDKSFNITKNFGLDTHGRVVLMDLGELYSSQEAIQKQLAKRMWASRYVVREIKNKELRDYYIDQMDAHFKLTNV